MRAVIVVTRRGDTVFISKQAAAWLAETGTSPRELLERLRGRENETSSDPLWLEPPASRIRVSRADANRKGSVCLILEKLPVPRETISGREAEVLFWLTYAKANGDIAKLMRIRTCTVRKHLERLFDKLGVDNRTAAASFGHLLFESGGLRRPDGSESKPA